MTGLFTGIIGSLIGAGIQAAVGGIPVSEDASKAIDVLRQGGLPVPPANWFSTTPPKEHNSQQIQPFDKIGQHVAGAHQVLGSCMKIAKAFEDFAYPRSESQQAAGSYIILYRFDPVYNINTIVIIIIFNHYFNYYLS